MILVLSAILIKNIKPNWTNSTANAMRRMTFVAHEFTVGNRVFYHVQVGKSMTKVKNVVEWMCLPRESLTNIWPITHQPKRRSHEWVELVGDGCPQFLPENGVWQLYEQGLLITHRKTPAQAGTPLRCTLVCLVGSLHQWWFLDACSTQNKLLISVWWRTSMGIAKRLLAFYFHCS